MPMNKYPHRSGVHEQIQDQCSLANIDIEQCPRGKLPYKNYNIS
jgi:hypothetical protein